MNCPRCNVALDGHKYRDLEVDHCPNCRGLWLDFDEMDLLEDSANKEEVLKGTRDYARRPGDLPCPHCDALMDVFNYRAYNLPIEHCPNNHGYWLDKGEEDRVLELMKPARPRPPPLRVCRGAMGPLHGTRGQTRRPPGPHQRPVHVALPARQPPTPPHRRPLSASSTCWRAMPQPLALA